ncbi:hypothetical protein CC86DRAFT_385576 [Ophiobolus disseminans]|uniref:Uncharacterized protein n=1 Tax=Ophiobolus disseminans TaxID=1469910 RepID=A0A6A6ZNI0_9PLEO|nr:hypothetical protein CC86DRAFT_385576 [Ophiobolus disseminans]
MSHVFRSIAVEHLQAGTLKLPKLPDSSIFEAPYMIACSCFEGVEHVDIRVVLSATRELTTPSCGPQHCGVTVGFERGSSARQGCLTRVGTWKDAAKMTDCSDSGPIRHASTADELPQMAEGGAEDLILEGGLGCPRTAEEPNSVGGVLAGGGRASGHAGSRSENAD